MKFRPILGLLCYFFTKIIIVMTIANFVLHFIIFYVQISNLYSYIVIIIISSMRFININYHPTTKFGAKTLRQLEQMHAPNGRQLALLAFIEFGLSRSRDSVNATKPASLQGHGAVGIDRFLFQETLQRVGLRLAHRPWSNDAT